MILAVIKNSEDFTAVASPLGALKIDFSTKVRNVKNSFYYNCRNSRELIG